MWSWLKYIGLAAAVGRAVAELLVVFGRQPLEAEGVTAAVVPAIKAIESSFNLDIPEDLIAELIRADIEIIERYQAQHK
jgi:hypothetical protein